MASRERKVAVSPTMPPAPMPNLLFHSEVCKRMYRLFNLKFFEKQERKDHQPLIKDTVMKIHRREGDLQYNLRYFEQLAVDLLGKRENYEQLLNVVKKLVVFEHVFLDCKPGHHHNDVAVEECNDIKQQELHNRGCADNHRNEAHPCNGQGCLCVRCHHYNYCLELHFKFCYTQKDKVCPVPGCKEWRDRLRNSKESAQSNILRLMKTTASTMHAKLCPSEKLHSCKKTSCKTIKDYIEHARPCADHLKCPKCGPNGSYANDIFRSVDHTLNCRSRFAVLPADPKCVCPAVIMSIYRHCLDCKLSSDECTEGYFCAWMKSLIHHLDSCRDLACIKSDCIGLRLLRDHFNKCGGSCTMCSYSESYVKFVLAPPGDSSESFDVEKDLEPPVPNRSFPIRVFSEFHNRHIWYAEFKDENRVENEDTSLYNTFKSIEETVYYPNGGVEGKSLGLDADHATNLGKLREKKWHTGDTGIFTSKALFEMMNRTIRSKAHRMRICGHIPPQDCTCVNSQNNATFDLPVVRYMFLALNEHMRNLIGKMIAVNNANRESSSSSASSVAATVVGSCEIPHEKFVTTTPLSIIENMRVEDDEATSAGDSGMSSSSTNKKRKREGDDSVAIGGNLPKSPPRSSSGTVMNSITMLDALEALKEDPRVAAIIAKRASSMTL